MNAQSLDLRMLARALGGEISGDQVLAPGPRHSPSDRSLAVKVSIGAPDGFVVFSHAGDDPLECRDYVRQKAGFPPFEPTRTRSRVVAEYIYRLADGSPYLRVQRTDEKQFWQSHWANGEWVKGKPPGDPVPYRLTDILDAVHDTVFVVEGEKDADRLASLGFVATTSPEGAGKWRASLNRWFKGKTVYVLADNDTAGQRHAEMVASNLAGVASSVRVVDLPGLVEKGDVSDWLDDGGDTSTLVDLCAAQPVWKARDEATEKPHEKQSEKASERTSQKANSRAMRLSVFGDLEMALPSKPWLIKGVLARGETSAWIAPPKGGKSTLIVDLAVAVASGRDWRGYQSKQAAGVVYLAFEREGDVKRMLTAHKVMGARGLPIAVAGSILDMMDPGSVDIIVDTIREAERMMGHAVGLLVLDTFAKAIAAGGGDEDKARDQGRVFANLQRIKEKTGVHIAIIGHTGKDTERGARGSNALLGDVDMMVEISGDDVRRAVVTAANDRDTGLVTAFRIERFVLGHDEDGDEITTRVISGEVIEDELSGEAGHFEDESVPGQSRDAKVSRDSFRRGRSVPPRKPRGEKGHLIGIVEKAINEAGENAPSSDHIPAGVRVVSRDTIRAYARTAGYRDGHSAETIKRSLNRDLSALAGDGVIVIHANLVWLTGKGGTKPGHSNRDSSGQSVPGQRRDTGTQGHFRPPYKGDRISVPDVPCLSRLEDEEDPDAFGF